MFTVATHNFGGVPGARATLIFSLLFTLHSNTPTMVLDVASDVAVPLQLSPHRSLSIPRPSDEGLALLRYLQTRSWSKETILIDLDTHDGLLGIAAMALAKDPLVILSSSQPEVVQANLREHRSWWDYRPRVLPPRVVASLDTAWTPVAHELRSIRRWKRPHVVVVATSVAHNWSDLVRQCHCVVPRPASFSIFVASRKVEPVPGVQVRLRASVVNGATVLHERSSTVTSCLPKQGTLYIVELRVLPYTFVI